MTKMLSGISSVLTFIAQKAETLPDGNIISFDSELIKGLAIILFNVLILVVILALVLYKPVRKFMDKRSKGIEDSLEESAKTFEEANALKAKYELLLKGIEDERKREMELANKRAEERCDVVLKEAYEEADHIRAHALTEIDEERITMQNDINKQLVELSVLISSRFLEDNIDEKSHEKYIAQALADWEEGL